MNTILSIVALIVFIILYVRDIKRLRRNEIPFKKSPTYYFTIYTLLIIVVSYVLVNVFFQIPVVTESGLFGLSVLLSALISRVWVMYIRWIDIFEPERSRYLWITFILSCLTIWLVFPVSNTINTLGFVLNGEPLNDFLYSVIGIGMVEEAVKIIPVLLMIKLSKQVNEPIDYIVYASVSALGFAFIENILYLQNTQLSSLSARLLYSSVAHMFFSSIIAYSLALTVIKPNKSFTIQLGVGFVLAALAHGFYDFWLINEEFYLPALTTFFLIGSLHVWVILKNNLINHSNFYTPEIKLNQLKIKYKLLTFLVLAIYIGYIAFAMLHGANYANEFIIYVSLSFTFLVVYLSVSFSSFTIIPGYTAPIKFPKKFFLPKIESFPNHTGKRIEIKTMGKNKITNSYQGRFVKRMVLNSDYNWYWFEEDKTGLQLLVKPHAFSEYFDKHRAKRLIICTYKLKITNHDLQLIPKLMSKGSNAFGYEI